MSLALVALLAATSTPAFVFGSQAQGWYVLAHDGSVLERFSTLGNLNVKDVSISPDGKTFAFVSPAEGDTQDASGWLWQRAREPRKLVERVAHLGNPSFSGDGAWVLFTYGAMGPPGAHGTGKNAQLVRVRLDGTGFEQLTDSAGCKLAAASPRAGLTYFLHSSCHSTAIIASLPPSPALAGVPSGLNLSELAPSPDGRRLAVVERRMADVVIHELDVRSGRWSQLGLVEAPRTPQKPQWSRDGSFVAVQAGATVWKLASGARPVALASLTEQPR